MMSPIFIFLVLSLWLRLCISQSATRYSCFHLFHVFSLHRCTYLNLFVHSSESPSVVEFIVLTSLPRIMLFGVNTYKVGLSPSKKGYVICLIKSPLKMMKNAFYFILKALFVLKIFNFLSQLFCHVVKMA